MDEEERIIKERLKHKSEDVSVEFTAFEDFRLSRIDPTDRLNVRSRAI